MIVSMAYEYLDKKKELYDKYFNTNNIVFYPNKNNNDMDLLKFEVFDENTNKVIVKGTYSTMGFFNTVLSTWYWGWAVPFPSKSENYLSRKMLLYALDMDINQNNNINVYGILKAELLNSKIFMDFQSIEIEKYIALSMYITKSDYYHKLDIESINVITQKKENIGHIYYFLRNIEFVNS